MDPTSTATVQLPQQDHRIPPAFRPRTRCVQSLGPLFIPEILFEIGAYLKRRELWSTSLVCVTWHKVFSPFLNWTALDNCDGFLDTLGYSHNRYQLLDALLERIGGPDAAFGFHNARNVHLSNRSIVYYILDKEKISPQLDRLHLMIIEKSTLLTKLRLSPFHLTSERCYRWATKLKIEAEYRANNPSLMASHLCPGWGSTGPLSMTSHRLSAPRWPCLIEVSLGNCRVDHSFLQILLSNAPALEDLNVFCVVVNKAEPLEIKDDRTDCSVIQVLQDEREGKKKHLMHETFMATSVLSKLAFLNTEGLEWADILFFASQLPLLSKFSFHHKEPWSKGVLPFTSGFPCLLRLAFENLPHDMIASIVSIVPTGLGELSLDRMQLGHSFVQSLQPAHTHTLRKLHLSSCPSIEGNDHVPHLILCTLTGLESVTFYKEPMVCDPRILQQTPWACRNLRVLGVTPKCNGSPHYSSMEAQRAFLTQVGSLTRLEVLFLTELHFYGVENGFAPEKSWTLLQGLKQLTHVDLGVAPTTTLTDCDAKMMIRYWPRLSSLHGIHPEGSAAFVDYMKKHRQFIHVFYRVAGY